MQSVVDSADGYRRDLHQAATASLVLENKDFDTGRVTVEGEYRLTDETYAQLLDRLAKDHFTQVSAGLRANLLAYYSSPAAFGIHSKIAKEMGAGDEECCRT